MKTALLNLARREGRRAASRARWTVRVGREGVMDAIHATRHAAESVRDRGVNTWKQWFKEFRRPVRRLSRRKRHFEEQLGFYRTEWGVERELEALIGRDRPLILGPWFSEVGFETLYWIPFLHWVQAAFRIPADRMVAVSRGGVESWYHGLAGRYVEIWDEFDPAEFARRNAERGITKQYELSSLDHDILDRVAARLGTREFDVIHPGLMYRLFTLYWSGQRAMGFVDSHTRWVRHQPPRLIDPALLPRDYVAVKFYAARSLPDSPAMRDRLRSIVRTIAESSPVVLLDTGLVLEDDHADYTWSGDRGVISAKPWMTPQNNLGVQTQIVAGARAFVGTCGSIAWLAPRLGVDTSALYLDPKWLHAHLAVAMRAYHKLEGGGRFAPADLRGLDALLPQNRSPRVKVLFIARHFTYFRNFDSAIEALAAKGHQLHLAADRDEAQGGRDLVDALAKRHSTITVGDTPIRAFGRYTRVSRALRLGLDYLRYSDPRYESMPKIRQRAYERTPAFVLALARLPLRGLLVWLLERLEEAVPRHAGVDEFIARHAPDLLLVTPLIELGSPQLDYLRAARRARIRTALCVWSWDHLSSKALIRVQPDALLVWNEVQRAEAERFHGIAPDRVIVTGAQCFDRWFDRQPSHGRREFCRRAGLPDEAPFVLYVCSALFRGSPSEAAFVQRWVEAIRAAGDPTLRGVNLLVRPHPQRMDEWAGRSLDGAVLWGSNPIDAESRADYFDSLYHSAAVVGLNTSALVEAAIVDRPVYTILLPEFRDNQEGTFHFHHLMTVGEGFLHASRTLAEHVTQLAAQFRGAALKSNRGFVERFIRPRGVAVASTPVFVDAAERLAAAPRPAAATATLASVVFRPLVYALVLAGRLPLLERLYWNPAKFRLETR